MEDDYGDGAISTAFYKGEIPEEQKRIAKRTRQVIEKKVGRFETLRSLVGVKDAAEPEKKRANLLFTRALPVQWVQGNAAVAETSFFKINTQGTALDETEEMLIRNRRKAIAIAARAILRAGTGHKYWSQFAVETKGKIEQLADQFYTFMFKPEVEQPLKTLELPLGGSVSPVDALALLIEFLTIAGTRDSAKTGEKKKKTLADLAEDVTGEETVEVLTRSLEIVEHITGNTPKSLGLHPAVYFYNDRGQYSRFMFLGITLLFTERIQNNDRNFFKKFKQHREKLEEFLINNRSLVGILLQNMSKSQRVIKMRDLFVALLSDLGDGKAVTAENVIKHLGLQGRIIDVVSATAPVGFTDDTKSTVFIRDSLKGALVCPECKGKLDPKKSVSYDHVKRRREGGRGEPENCSLVHPYCNSIKG